MAIVVDIKVKTLMEISAFIGQCTKMKYSKTVETDFIHFAHCVDLFMLNIQSCNIIGTNFKRNGASFIEQRSDC